MFGGKIKKKSAFGFLVFECRANDLNVAYVIMPLSTTDSSVTLQKKQTKM